MENGILHFAGNIISPLKTHLGFSQKWNESKDKNIVQEVRIVPKGSCFVVEVIYNLSRTYKEGDLSCLFDSSRHIGIDLGINNLLSIVSNQPDLKPVLVNGKHLKSLNAWFNRRAASLRSTNNWKHLNAIGFKRHRQMRDALHKASNFVRAYCLDNDIGLVVIGHNKGWKQNVNLGKVNNQKFVSIPHSVLISQIQYKFEAAGIKVVMREEAYTSKASLLHNDAIPSYPIKEDKPSFSGKRVARGLYKSPLGLINADVNAAGNILRKETGDAFGPTRRGVVFSPVVVTLGKNPKPITRKDGLKSDLLTQKSIPELKPIPILELV